MRLGVLATIGKDWRASVERVRIAEDLGYEHVATGEAWGPSALPFLALVAANTSRITLGTSIVNFEARAAPLISWCVLGRLPQQASGDGALGLAVDRSGPRGATDHRIRGARREPRRRLVATSLRWSRARGDRGVRRLAEPGSNRRTGANERYLLSFSP